MSFFSSGFVFWHAFWIVLWQSKKTLFNENSKLIEAIKNFNQLQKNQIDLINQNKKINLKISNYEKEKEDYVKMSNIMVSVI